MEPHPLDIDEFAALADEAAEFDIAVSRRPQVRREDTHTPDGIVSSLIWGIGPPEIVLLHGAGLNAHTWDAVVLSLDRPALAIDLPGHGRSSWRPDGRYDPRLMAPSVAAVIERLAADAPAVAGQSLGGFVAIALADMRDDLVGRQILIDALPPAAAPASAPPGGGAETVRSFLAGPESFASRQEIVERALEWGFGASRAAVERGVVHNTVARPDGRWVWRHHLGQSPATFSTAGDFDALWSSLEAFPRMVTLVRAARGIVSDVQVARLLDRVPTVEVLTVDTGHNVQEDDPVALADILEPRLVR